MTRILSLASLLFFIALPIATLAAPEPVDIHRMGAKNNPLGGAVRPVDWHMTGDTVHAHESKGLSLNSIHPGAPADPKKQKVWSISDHHFDNHPDFKVVHNGGQDNGNGGVHPDGHASLIYHGPDIHKDELKEKIKNLPWHKRSFGGNAGRAYRRSVMAEKAYRREQLEKVYRRALEALEEMD